jgi:hypothetical protein
MTQIAFCRGKFTQKVFINAPNYIRFFITGGVDIINGVNQRGDAG